MKSKNFCRLFSAILMALFMSFTLLNARELQTKDEFSSWDGTWVCKTSTAWGQPCVMSVRIDSQNRDIRLKCDGQKTEDYEAYTEYYELHDVAWMADTQVIHFSRTNIVNYGGRWKHVDCYELRLDGRTLKYHCMPLIYNLDGSVIQCRATDLSFYNKKDNW